MSLNFQQLRCFHAVAVHGGFTSAAHALNVGQPSITTHIKALEERFGIELFGRHGRSVQLTDTGKRLLERTQVIFKLELEAEEILRSGRGHLEGNLRIAAFDPVQVTRTAAEFGKQYPHVSLEVSFGNNQMLIDSLLGLSSDVAVLPCQNDKRLFTVPWRRAHIVLLVHADHAWAGLGEIELQELAGQNLISRERGSMQQRLFDEMLECQGISMRKVLEIDSQDAVREAIASGLGVGIALGLPAYSDSRLSVVRIKNSPLYLDMVIACLTERQNTPIISAFLQSISKEITNENGAMTRPLYDPAAE